MTTAAEQQPEAARAPHDERTYGASDFHNGGPPQNLTQLFRYLNSREVSEYHTILNVFAGAFFAEMTAEDVAAALEGSPIDPDVLPARLKKLADWGNLTTSSSVQECTTIEDYQRRHGRYLLTGAGLQVLRLVEQFFAEAETVAAVRLGRLRHLASALSRVAAIVEDDIPAEQVTELGDGILEVFDSYLRFKEELERFFAQINEWQSHYDLTPEQVRDFAQVLTGYIFDRIDEITQATEPVATELSRILPRLPEVLSNLPAGLGQHGAGGSVSFTVAAAPGSVADHWYRLAGLFAPAAGSRRSQLDDYLSKAAAAADSLLDNVMRLSRGTVGSKRADLLRLATFFDNAKDDDSAHDIAAAAFGLGSCRSLVFMVDPDAEPEPTPNTRWKDAPVAAVPISLRTRGEIGPKGLPTPLPDRRAAIQMIKDKRDQQLRRRHRAASDLLQVAASDGSIDGARISCDALELLCDLVAEARLDGPCVGPIPTRRAVGEGLRCTLHAVPAATTTVDSDEGTLTFDGLVVSVTRALTSHATGH